MAQKVTCDKCGKEEPTFEAAGWEISMRGGALNFGRAAGLDLCPACIIEYDAIVEESREHQNKMLEDWLKK